MSDHMDVKTIATALGMGKRGCEIRASRESWPFEESTVRGGKKRLYPISSLPTPVREALMHYQIKTSPVLAPTTQPAIYMATNSTTLKDWQRKSAEARAAIINEIKRLAKAAGIEKAIQAVIALAANNELPEHLQRLVPVANVKAGKNGKRNLSRTSIYRWMAEAEQGFTALAPKNNPVIRVPAWASTLLGLYQQPQKPTLKKCLFELTATLPDGVSAPSYWAAQRFIDKMSKLDLARGRMLPRELKSVRAFVRRDTSQMWPGDCYTSDGHKFDAEIAHPRHGRPFRPEITSVLDIATRRCVGWSVDLAESTWAVLDALRHAVETCGINALHYVDNGSGQKNELMSNEIVGFMSRLGISMTHSLPYNSQARGLEERSHQTIWVRGAKDFPTYMGATMDREAKQAAFKVTRREINAVGTSRLLMQFPEFMKWCEAQVEAYNNRPHRGLAKITDPVTGKQRHPSPMEAWVAAMTEGWEPVMLKPGEADDLFRPYKIGKTHRAEVRLHGNIYFNKELEHYHGEQVRIGYDIHDGSRVWVRDMEGRLICVAEFEANKTAYFPQSQIDVATRKRAEGRIKRAEAHIEEAEAELNPPLAIEHQAAITLPVFEFRAMPQPVCNPAPGMPAIQAEQLPANAEYLPIPRPMFTTDAAKYRWLRTNASQVTAQDDTWLDWYCNTDEWEDLFGGLEEAAAR
ncbi:MAG: Mu transposase C-terminal domain-containing protein [Gallionellaceae bacterium]|nr:Mu transposase C-terminal domain-containing protein [Gallionellaceae bacterium]